ncbi:MAG: TFIIB-type zinc ribbon-containing protein [Candidatus Nitrosocaldus sp.]
MVAIGQRSCPECSSILIEDQSSGEYFCSSCGYVAIEHIPSLLPESIAREPEERLKSSRSSGYTSYAYHDLGISTEIPYANKDFTGKSIDSSMVEQVASIRRWHTRLRVSSSRDRRLYNVLSKINEICSILSLPKIVCETASLLYRNFESRSEAKGRSIACMAAASVYLACKRCSIVRSMDEIVEVANCIRSKKLVYRYYRMLAIEQDASSNVVDAQTSVDKQEKREEYTQLTLDRYISKLSNLSRIDTKVEKLAIDIARKIEHEDNNAMIDGKAPTGLAAAYIYIAAMLLGIRMLQHDISSVSKVTEVTVRNRCREILSNYRIRLLLKPAQP